MGEYFGWFNVSKKEKLEAGPFDTGIKMADCVIVGNEWIDAVCTLISSDWADDDLVFLGDEKHVWEDENPNPVLVRLMEDCEYEPCAFDDVDDKYSDVAGSFKVARGVSYWYCNGEDSGKRQYEGSFDRDVIHYRYVINETKKQFLDRGRTPVQWTTVWHKGKEEKGAGRIDPFPVLMSCGDRTYGMDYLRDNESLPIPDGYWLGDRLNMSQTPPGSEYEDISSWYRLGYLPLITEPDEVVLPIIESDEFQKVAKASESVSDWIHEMELLRKMIDET